MLAAIYEKRRTFLTRSLNWRQVRFWCWSHLRICFTLYRFAAELQAFHLPTSNVRQNHSKVSGHCRHSVFFFHWVTTSAVMANSKLMVKRGFLLAKMAMDPLNDCIDFTYTTILWLCIKHYVLCEMILKFLVFQDSRRSCFDFLCHPCFSFNTHNDTQM